MSRLDHNRVVGMAAAELGISAELIDKVIVWGNHSDTMVVDTAIAEVDGVPLERAFAEIGVDLTDFAHRIKTRGKHIIGLRGASSAASAAKAASDHMHDWTSVNHDSSWTSVAMPSYGEYDLPVGVFASMPVRYRPGGAAGKLAVVEGLTHPRKDHAIAEGIRATGQQLLDEKAELQRLGFLPS
ncbi:MAG TPA: hypothetical protein VFX86_02510 [Candidatus Saccharimonadales bacterium]|nr:hypothetical protein [Candidatus Saccharimonadales bacterium]